MESQTPPLSGPASTTRRAFAESLQRLNTAGLSYRELMARCRANNAMLDHRTIGTWFAGTTLPSPKYLDDFRVLLNQLGVVDRDEVEQWIAAVRRLRKTRITSDVVPYRGLDSYGVEDAAYFFGRDALVDATVQQLHGAHEASGGAVLVVGPSGAGKTSLLEAGVRPALARNAIEGSTNWSVLSFKVDSKPIDQLAAALARELEEDPQVLATELRETPHLAANYLTRIALVDFAPQEDGLPPQQRGAPAQHHDRTVLVIVDQLEQALITDGESSAEESELTKFLTVLEAITTGSCGAVVVLGLRADQYGAAQNNLQLQRLTGGRQVSVTPMNDDELRAVIAEPALKNGFDLEPGFVELLVREVTVRSGKSGHSAALLPQLSHALRKTWLAGDGKSMTVENYQRVGGLERAVTDSAEAVFAELTPAQRSVTRKLFFRLVLVHPTASDTRRQVLLSELPDESEDPELYEVLYRFAAPGLLTVDAETVEITHESLLFTWQRLRGWLDTDRNGRVLAQQLTADAATWQKHGRDKDLVYKGTRLDGAREWLAHTDDSPGLVEDFINAGVHRSRRRTRRLRRVIALLSVLLLVVGMLTVVVVVQERSATRERDQAVSRMIASEINTLRDVDVSSSMQLALVAYRISPTKEARAALIDATALRPAVRMLADENKKTLYAVAPHPTLPVVAMGLDNNVRFFSTEDAGHPKLLPPLPSATCERINALSFTPQGGLLAAACRDGRVLLWDTTSETPRALDAPVGLAGNVYSVAFSPSGSLLAAAVGADGGQRGEVRLWRVTGDVLTPLGSPLVVDRSAAKSVSIHPGDDHLAVGTQSGLVQIWDISTPEVPTAPVTVNGPTKAIGQLAFSPDGRHLVACGANNGTYLWDVTDPRAPVPAGDPISGNDSWNNAVAFSPDSSKLAVASSDAVIGARLFDVTTRTLLATMPHPTTVTSVKFTPNGEEIITGANDSTVRSWPVHAPSLRLTDYSVSSTRFRPDGDVLAVGSADLRLYDMSDPQRPRPLGTPITNQDGFSGSLAFSPDGRTLAESRGRSGTIQIYDVTDPARPQPLGQPLTAHQDQVEHLSINPAGTVMATGGRDGAVRLWSLGRPEKPELLATPHKFNGFVHWTAFNHDGTLLVAGGADRSVRVWNISDPTTPVLLGAPFTPAPHYVYSTVFSPDGKTLAISLGDSSVHLYDMTDPAHPAKIGSPLTGPNDYAYSVAFSNDGNTLAGAYNDGTIWTWNIRDRAAPAHMATLTLPHKDVYTIQFQPGHSRIAAGGTEKIPRIWNTDIDQAAAQICETTGTPITPAEWARYVPDHDYGPPCGG